MASPDKYFTMESRKFMKGAWFSSTQTAHGPQLKTHSYSVRNAVTGFANAAFTAW